MVVPCRTPNPLDMPTLCQRRARWHPRHLLNFLPHHPSPHRWLTLTDFVTHLGRKGLCKVEETPKGWFITLIQVRLATCTMPPCSAEHVTNL